jgi:hypothetical protein
MNPHLRYSQVRRGHNNDEGLGDGIIELKDLYYFLDAVRILKADGAVADQDDRDLSAWLEEYAEWLETSPQGIRERAADNNHGTYYDLHFGAIAAYLKDTDRLRHTLMRAESRLFSQITPDGGQPHEMKRTLTQHYCFFNLQGWLNLMQLARSHGLVMLMPQEEPLRRVAAALRWVLSQDQSAWPFEQSGPFDLDRASALALSAARLNLLKPSELPDHVVQLDYFQRNPTLNPHDAVNPFWNLNAASL